MLEFFAGKANLSRAMRMAGMAVASFDILYDASDRDRGEPYMSNAMDMCSASGFALVGRRFENKFNFDPVKISYTTESKVVPACDPLRFAAPFPGNICAQVCKLVNGEQGDFRPECLFIPWT